MARPNLELAGTFTMVASMFACLIAVTSAACGQPVGGDPALGRFLTPDGNLAEKFVISNSQSGAAGRAGREIIVEPNGKWRKFSFYGSKQRTPVDEGKLSPDQVRQLAEVLASEAFAEFPREFGKTDPTSNPNPRYVKVAFGDTRTELLLPPRTNMADYMEQADEKDQKLIRKLENILRAVERLSETSLDRSQ